MATNEKNHSIVVILAVFVAIGFVAGYITTDKYYCSLEAEIKTIENNNRELAERASNLSKRIGITSQRIGKSAADIGEVRTEIASGTERLIHITDGVSRVSAGLGSSIGKAETAERIIEECIRLVEEIEKQ